MILLLIIGFRKIGGVVLPLVVVMLSVIWMVGLVVMTGTAFDMLTAIVPIILVAMGSADGIHIMRRYYEVLQTGKTPTMAIRETYAELTAPIVITTVTTAIGFLSLSISDFTIIRNFGMFAAVGVFFALMVSFLLFPALLPYSKIRAGSNPPQKQNTINRLMDGVAKFIFYHKIPVLLVAAVLVVISVVAIPNIKKSVDWSLCLQKGSKAHMAEMILRRDFGGTVPLQILVNGNIKDPETLKVMRYVEQYLDSIPSLGEIQSMSVMMSEMNDVMNKRFTVPRTKKGVSNLWSLVEEEKIVEQMVKDDGKEGLIHARINTWDSSAIIQAVEKVDSFIGILADKLINTASATPAVPYSQLRLEQVVDGVVWALQAKGITVEPEGIVSILQEVFATRFLGEKERAFVYQRLKEYLLSEDSEIEITSGIKADGIANKIAGSLIQEEKATTETVSAILQDFFSEEAAEDVAELAISLIYIGRETVGDIKVTQALQKILKLIPANLEKEKNLLRKLRGNLWEMNAASSVSSTPVSLEIVGMATVLKQMEEELTPTQILSLLTALAVVFVILSIMFRSVLIGLIGVIPIVITILINFAVMVFLDIGLDSFTAMVASIAIGLGIDTAVHFMSNFKQQFLQHRDELRALQETMKTTGIAILINTVVVGTGFSVLLLATGQHIRRFGGLASLTIFLSAILTFTVVPAILLLLKPDFLKKEVAK